MSNIKITKEKLSKASLIELADYIIQELPQLAVCNKDLYKFNGKFYELISDHELGRDIFDFYKKHAPKLWNPPKASYITQAIKYHHEVKLVKEFDNYDSLINFNNVVVDIDQKTEDALGYKTYSHSSDFLFTTAIKFDYDPTQRKAPFFIQTLRDIFRIDKDNSDEDTILNVLQLGGYLLYPQIKMNKLFLFYGEGSNGKGIIMDTYQMFFDERFVSALSLNSLSQEGGFSRKILLTSRVNFATEQKSGNIESDELKKISGGDHISIERKHEDTIVHRVKTKILVSLNKLARFKDVSHGMKRRLFIIKFKNRFVEPVKYKDIKNPQDFNIYPQKAEDEIKENIKSEGTAIANLFLESLDYLRKNNWQFLETRNQEEVFSEYNEEADPTGTWLQNNYTLASDSEHPLPLNELFLKYKEWYDNENSDRKFMVSKRVLSKRIKDLFRVEPFVLRYRNTDGSPTTSTCFNLKLKEEECEIEKAIFADNTHTDTNIQKEMNLE